MTRQPVAMPGAPLAGVIDQLAQLAVHVQLIAERIEQDEAPAVVLADLASVAETARAISRNLLQEHIRRCLPAEVAPSAAQVAEIGRALAIGARLRR